MYTCGNFWVDNYIILCKFVKVFHCQTFALYSSSSVIIHACIVTVAAIKPKATDINGKLEGTS